MEICTKDCWSLLLRSNRVREYKELIRLSLLLKEVAEFVPGSAESFVQLVEFLNVIVGNHPFQIPQPGHQVTQILVVLVVVGVQIQGTAVLIVRRIQIHERLWLR